MLDTRKRMNKLLIGSRVPVPVMIQLHFHATLHVSSLGTSVLSSRITALSSCCHRLGAQDSDCSSASQINYFAFSAWPRRSLLSQSRTHGRGTPCLSPCPSGSRNADLEEDLGSLCSLSSMFSGTLEMRRMLDGVAS